MMSKTLFYIILGVALAWFYAGSILVWRFVLPELYSLLIKRQDVDKKAILAKEKARREKRKK
jgi:hypothetical protein